MKIFFALIIFLLLDFVAFSATPEATRRANEARLFPGGGFAVFAEHLAISSKKGCP